MPNPTGLTLSSITNVKDDAEVGATAFHDEYEGTSICSRASAICDGNTKALILLFHADEQRGMASTVATYIQSLMSAIASAKLFHWRTRSFAAHEASGLLANSLFAKMDTLVEAMLAHSDVMILDNVQILIAGTGTDREFMDVLQSLRVKLSTMEGTPYGKFTELLNMRDDILGAIDDFVYKQRFS